MARWIRVGGGVLGAVAVGGVAAVATAALRWDRATARAVRRLSPSAPDAETTPAAFSPDQLAGLPAPVARYFAFALTPGQRFVRSARVEHSGQFLIRPGRWRPFTSVEHFAVRPPGFVWDAAIRMAPFVTTRVRDGYVDGEGAMYGAVAALVPVVDQRGTREMAAASLHRFLAEAPWVPTTLLPTAGVVWTAIDDSTARATLTDRGTTVSADFSFAPRGEVVRVSAERYRDVGGTLVRTPWVGHFQSYARAQGMMVPMAGDVGWDLPDGRLSYWRGRVTRVEYEFAP